MPPIESISCRWPVAAMPIGMSCKTGCAWSVMALILFGRAKKQRFGWAKDARRKQRMHDGRTRFRGTIRCVERCCAGVNLPEGEIHVASEGSDRALGGGAGAGRLWRDA